MYRHIQAHAHVARTETVCPSTDSLAPKLCACAYANTVLCVRQHRLPPLLVTVTSVPVTDLSAVVDPTKELLLEWFLSVGLCGSGTNLF